MYEKPLTWLDYMQQLITWFSGKKTYFLAFALFAYTLGGYFSGHMTMQEALGLLWGSGVITSLRAAIAKLPNQQ